MTDDFGMDALFLDLPDTQGAAPAAPEMPPVDNLPDTLGADQVLPAPTSAAPAAPPAQPSVDPVPPRPGAADQRPMTPPVGDDAPLFVHSNAIANRAYQMAKEQGLPANHVVAILKQESNFDPTRRPIGKDGKPLSSAFGIGQLLTDERTKSGIGDSTDPEVQLRAVMPKMRDAYDRARKALGRDPTPGEMYVVYYQGAGAGPRILSNPSASLKDTLDGVKPGWGKVVYDANPWLAKSGIVTNADFIAWTSGKMNTALGAKSVPTNFTSTIPRSETAPPFAPAGSQADDAILQDRVTYKPSPTLWRTVEAAADETTTAYVFRDSPVFAPAPDYKPTIEELEARKQGLPEKFHDRLIGVSPAHSDYLTAQAQRQAENERTLAEAGWTGTGIQLAADILDPVSLGAGIASGGLGAFAGGTMKAGRLVQRVAGGLGAAAGNIALTGIADAAGKETASSDYAYAAAWGLGLGFAFGPLARNPATQDLADEGAHAASRAMADIERGLPRFSGGEGTLSAAPASVDNVKLSQGNLMSIVDADVPRTAVESLRPDMAGRGATSDNPLMRAVSQSLGLDVVGKVGPNGEMAVNPFSAGEDKLRIMSAGSNRLYSVAYPQFDEWAKARGVNWMKRVSPRLTDEWETFADQITAHRRDLRADRDAHYDPQVVNVSKELGTALEEHRQGNITPRPETPDNPGRPLAGMENVPANPRYMPRVYRLDKIMAIDPTGRKFIGWLEGSLLSAHKELGDKAETLARGLYSGVVRRGFNLDEFAMMARDGATADILRSGMLDIGMSEADIADILARLPKGSKPGFTHLRLDLDETFVHPRTGLKLGDFTETNAFDLFDHYNHQASAWRAAGRIQIVKADGEVLLDGIRSRKEISDVLQQVADKGYQAGLTPKQIEDDTALLREMFDRLFGVPHEKASSTVAKGAEIVRNLATMTSAGNFGLSAIPDMARIATVGGLRAMLQHMPALRTEIVRGGVLRPRSELAMDIAAFGAVDEFRHLSARRLPEDGMLTTPMQGVLDKIGGYTRTGADAVVHLSGMNIINRGVREAARRVMASRFYRDAEAVFASGGTADLAKLSPAELNRMKWFGLGDDMLTRVLREVKEHGETVDHWTGAKLNRLNPDAWTDDEAKHAFTMALNRAAGRASMEHDFGSGTVWDRSPIFRTFSQLRRFGLNAWHMNILHGYAMRDPEVFWDVAASTFAAAALYAARTRIEAATRSDPEKHLQERFAPGAFAAAVFQLGAYSSLIPALVDTGIGVAGANPLFGFRNSALPSDAWFGNPSVTFLNNLFRVAPSAFMQPIVAGRERSQPEWRQMLSILPFSNNIAVQSALGLLVQDAPRFAPKSQRGYSLPEAVIGAVQ